jgi:ComF family protein
MELNQIKHNILHFFYPHNCVGCGFTLFNLQKFLCRHCLADLPLTHFERVQDNPVAKIFSGRLQIEKATAWLFFAKNGITQNVIHALKYRNNQNIGLAMGAIMAESLHDSDWWQGVDVLIPLPLNRKKLLMRGYNQAEVLCRGIASFNGIPIEEVAVMRKVYTETQTHKSRIQRWRNVAEVFDLLDYTHLQNKHAVLVDDVVTTGATLDACGQILSKVPGLKLSLLSLAIASKV